MKDYSERLNEEAGYVFPEPEGVADEKTLALANQFLEHLAHGMFPDGEIDPELMTWAERSSLWSLTASRASRARCASIFTSMFWGIAGAADSRAWSAPAESPRRNMS